MSKEFNFLQKEITNNLEFKKSPEDINNKIITALVNTFLENCIEDKLKKDPSMRLLLILISNLFLYYLEMKEKQKNKEKLKENNDDDFVIHIEI